MQKLIKKIGIAGGVLVALALLVSSFAVNTQAATTWNTTGTYVVAFEYLGPTYTHDMILNQDGLGNLTGNGGSPAGSNVYTWVINSGTVVGNTITFTANYTATADAVSPQTTMNVTGTIATDGTMSGTWTDNYQNGARAGSWSTTSGTAMNSSTVVISGDTSAGENQPGWMFNRDANTSTPFEFNTAEASIGTGSLYVMPIGSTSSDKFIGENFINTPIADVNSISYDFMIAGSGTAVDAGQFYMNVYANFGSSDPLKFYDCRYNVVPVVGSVAGFTTVTFDPTMAYPVTSRVSSPFACPAIPADMDSLSAGSNIRVFALNVGDTSNSDVGLAGYLDKVVVSIGANTTTYDFEPVAPVTHMLTATVAGTGLGTVTSVPAGINCPGDCTESYATGTSVTLTATPAVGSTFTGWSGDCTGTGSCVVTMDSAMAATATFTLNVVTPPTTPMTKDDCKKDGWKTFTNPSFKNQGQCVSFTNHQ